MKEIWFEEPNSIDKIWKFFLYLGQFILKDQPLQVTLVIEGDPELSTGKVLDFFNLYSKPNLRFSLEIKPSIYEHTVKMKTGSEVMFNLEGGAVTGTCSWFEFTVLKILLIENNQVHCLVDFLHLDFEPGSIHSDKH